MSETEHREFVCLEETTVPYQACAAPAYAGVAVALRADLTNQEDIIVIGKDEAALRRVWVACGMTGEPDANKFARVLVVKDRRKR